MMRDYIEIKKELIPYSFNIELLGSIARLEIKYNKKHDFFTVSLGKNGVIVCESEPIVYGMPLFGDVPISKKNPLPNIVPYDESGHENTVTFENLNNTVYLVLDNTGDML